MAEVKYKKQQDALSFWHLLAAHDVTKSDLEKILARATHYHQSAQNGMRNCKDAEGQILATLFFEPSTRTRFSFEAAMLRLGGQVISLEQGLSSSTKKGESLGDTGRIISGYADAIVVRHPDIGSAAMLSQYATVPVINGGDGANEHPTQSLADLYTIQLEKGRLDSLTIGIVGDLKHSRTVSSLIALTSLYPNNNFVFISHELLRLDALQRHALEKNGCKFRETGNLADALPDLDVLYVTRVQAERFSALEDYDAVKDSFCITPALLASAKPDLALMHPLPRVNEIHHEVDSLPQAKYFEQASRAVYVRMALLALMNGQ